MGRGFASLSLSPGESRRGLAGVTRLETEGEKIRAWKGLELEMVGTKLPRLTGQSAPDKLAQLEAWLR